MTIGPFCVSLRSASLSKLFTYRVLTTAYLLPFIIATSIVASPNVAVAGPLNASEMARERQGTPTPEVNAGNLLNDYFQVNLQLQTVTASGVTDGISVGDTNVANGPDATYVFDWSSFVPGRPGGTVDWTEGDWIGQYTSGDPTAGHIDVQHSPAPGSDDLDYYPSGGEQFDVEAYYFDNDADYLYIAVITSVPFSGTYTNGISGTVFDALGTPSTQFVGSTNGSIFYPGDLALDLGVGTPRTELNGSFAYDYGVDLVHENRTVRSEWTEAGWISASERNFNLGDQLYKTQYDTTGSEAADPPSPTSAWYTSVFKGFTTGGWSHTNFDPEGLPGLVESRGAVQTAYYEYTFPGGNQENDWPTYVVEFVIPRAALGADNPADGDTVGIRWVEGCRNDGNGIDGVLTLQGDIDDPTTVSLGDQVWFDADNGGTKSIGETGIPGVELSLWTADTNGNPAANTGQTTVTDADGYYIFNDLTPGDYIIQIADDQFVSGGALFGLTTSTGNDAPDGAPDPDDDVEDDDNGTSEAGLGVLSKAVTLTAGGEPADDDESGITPNVPTASSNQTVDFGFFEPLSLGDQVWLDENNDGLKNGGEPGIANVLLQLWTDNNGDAIPDTNTGLTSTTNADGYYLFDGLAPGNYFIVIPQSEFAGGKALEGLTSSTGNDPTFDPDDSALEGDDHGDILGTQSPVQGVASKSITLVSREEPTADDESGISGTAPDNSSNQTVDFGFFQPVLQTLSLGDQVWLDSDNSGIKDDGEPGIGGVVLNLWIDANNDDIPDTDTNQTATTTANGYYIFNDLAPGNYIVQIAPQEFEAGEPLNGLSSSTGLGEAADVDNSTLEFDDNGDPADGLGVISKAVTLSVGDEPTTDDESGITANAPDDSSNQTLDFGFFPQIDPNILVLGDRVWLDPNNNGQIDDGETGISGVTLNLWVDDNNDGTPDTDTGKSTTTDVNGYYLFENLNAADYIVQIPSSEFATGKPLEGLSSSDGNDDINGAPDPDNDVEDDDNGDPAGGLGVISKPITLSAGDEPVNDNESAIPGSALNEDSNKTIDFGFVPRAAEAISLGDQVWLDSNNNGQVDATESGITGVEVRLWSDDNGDGLPDTFTGLTDVTDASGFYLFDDLAPGDYVVQIATTEFGSGEPLAGLSSSTGNDGADGAPDPDDDVENDDNGDFTPDIGVISKAVTLTIGGEPTDDSGPSSGNATNENSNLTVDFGFVPSQHSLGNYIWFDDNNNGQVDEGEAPVPDGVRVELLAGDRSTKLAEVQTANGFYLFTFLSPGNYHVRLAATNFQTGGLLNSYTHSTGAQQENDPNSDGDQNDNGIDVSNPAADGIVSGIVQINVDEPVAESPTASGTPGDDGAGTADQNSNLTVDFGVIRVSHSLGNFVWIDTDNSGTVDDGELPVQDGVILELLDSAGLFLGRTAVTTNGFYLFSNLSAGQYRVRMAASNFSAGGRLAGFTHSTGAGQSEDPNNNVDQNDNGLDASDPPTEGISSGVVTINSDEPTGEAPSNTGSPGDDGLNTPDQNSNLTVDFGVVELTTSVSVGNLVWHDSDNDGQYNPESELGIAGVELLLFPEGADPSSGSPVQTQATDADGTYLFSGLTPGRYFIYIPVPPEAFPISSSRADENDNQEDNDNNGGQRVAGGPVASPVFELAPGTEPTNDGDGNNGDQTIDFGFWKPQFSLGNYVWIDSNNDGDVDLSESHVPDGVVLELLDSDGAPLGQNVQTESGFYLFSNLEAGDYRVRIAASNFMSGALLEGFVHSTGPGQEANPNSDGDQNDNGLDGSTETTEGITSNIVTIDSNEPENEMPTQSGIAGDDGAGTVDANSNLTVDFGVVASAALNLGIGNLIWNDENINGVADPGEPGIDNVQVQLFRAGDDPDSATPLAEQTTSGGGLYLFDNLMPGVYFVYIPNPQSPFTGSSPTTMDQDNGQDNDDNGIQSTFNGPVRSPDIVLTPNDEPVGESNPTGSTSTDPNNDLTVDFGFFNTPVAVGDRVWFDNNGNGIQEAGEEGVPNVRVVLFNVNDPNTPVLTTATFANGFYLFPAVPVGDYFVQFDLSTLPRGYIPTLQDAGSDDESDSDADPLTGISGSTGELAPGTSDLSLDFGIAPEASVGDYVWYDADQDGIQDSDETGIPGLTGQIGVPGVSVTLFTAEGESVATTTTDANGLYHFAELRPGNYYLNFNLPSGYVMSPSNAAPDDLFDSDVNPTTSTTPVFSLAAGQHDPTWDAGIYLLSQSPASLGDTVWLDGNANGIQDLEEVGIPGVVVELLDRNGTKLSQTTTDTNGKYRFANLAPRDYILRFVAPLGYQPSPTSATADRTLDSDADPITGRTAPITLIAGQDDLSWDAGFIIDPDSTGAIGDKVWYDQNGNGLQDEDMSQSGVPGLTVTLYRADGTIVRTTKTDIQGNYYFDILPAGDYFVGFDVPAGYRISPAEIGTDFTLDSDVDPQTLLTPQTTLTPGERDTSWDLGLSVAEEPPGGQTGIVSIGDLVWWDQTQPGDREPNGIQDPGEPGVPNVTVKLYDNVGLLIASTVTNQTGHYLFPNIPVGTYLIEFILPGDSGFVFTTQTSTPGIDGDSDVDGQTGRTISISVAGPEDDLSWDAGIRLDPGALEPTLEPQPGKQIYIPLMNSQ